MSKQEAIDNTMYSIIWWVGATKWSPELDKHIREEVEQLYDAGFEAGKNE